MGDNEKAAESFRSALQFDKQHSGARRRLQSLGGAVAATR
jgi:hypothetical protein